MHIIRKLILNSLEEQMKHQMIFLLKKYYLLIGQVKMEMQMDYILIIYGKEQIIQLQNMVLMNLKQILFKDQLIFVLVDQKDQMENLVGIFLGMIGILVEMEK